MICGRLMIPLVLLLLVARSSGLTCYACDSINHLDSCSEYELDEDNVPSMPCPTVCYKAVTKQGAVVKTQRGCLDVIPHPLLCMTTSSPFIETTLCYCDSDLCNAGTMVLFSHLYVVLSLVFVKIFV